jgi:hypothetical protein
MTTASERVTRGARVLDEVCPGWVKRIDLAVLDIASCLDCVLGQLYGTFDDGAMVVEDFSVGLARLGFDVEIGTHDVAALNQAWRAEIARRRA